MQLLIALYLFPWLVPSTANAKLETPSTWVVVADTCKNDFARLIGETGVNEECFYFINDGNGNYFIAGKTGNNSLIVQLDPLGNIIEQRTYDFTSGDDFVASLFLDDQGFLVGSARDRINSNTTNILFKINWQTGAVIWAKTLADPAYNRFDRVFQNPANGNYWVFGMTTNAHDNFLFEVDKNSGSVEWQYVSDYGGNGDAYIGYFLTSDAVYFSGMGRLADNLYDIRPTISKFDFNGNLVWAKMHLRSPSEPSRLYNVDLIIENDTIVNCGRGSLTGEDLTVSEMLFYKTNIDGDLIWAKSYTITAGSNVAGFKVLPIPNGYIVQGTFLENFSTPRVFVARLNKGGNVVWAKKIKTVTDAQGITKPLVLLEGNNIKIATQTTQFDDGVANDLLFGQLSLDGNSSSECTLFEDIELVESSISNPYDEFQTPVQVNSFYSYPSGNFAPQTVNLPLRDIPDCDCLETCANGLPLHTMPDAVLYSANVVCNGGNIQVTMTVCNKDSVALPSLTPVSFYAGNPTLSTANWLNSTLLPAPVLPGECVDFTGFVDNLPTNLTIFAVVNDYGSQTPFNLQNGLTDTIVQECDFTNNMANFQLNWIAPTLDIGPDISDCNFTSAFLDVGLNFETFIWSTGDTSPTLNVTQPGTYTVTTTDVCGITQTDAVTISIPDFEMVDIGYDSVQVCIGETFSFSLEGDFASLQWSPPSLVDCPTCPIVTVTVPNDTCFLVQASTSNGCQSADFICIEVVTDTAFSYQNRQVCTGGSYVFFGDTLTQPGVYQNINPNGSCVDVTTLTLSFFDAIAIGFSTEPACPFANDGAVTAIPSSGSLPYNFKWNVGLDSSSMLTGLDVGTYAVTVTDALGCIGVDSTMLGAVSRPLVSSVTEPVSCFGLNDGKVTFLHNDPSLKFTLLDTVPTAQSVFDNLWSGGYQYFVVDTFGCSWVQFFTIDSPEKIKVSLPASVDKSLCDSVQLTAVVSPSGITVAWIPPNYLSCTDCSSPYASPFDNTVYTLTALDSNGCSAMDSILVKVEDDSGAYLPNAFSPNDDNINDFFYVFSHCATEVRLFRIFDRWGEKLFEASNTPPNDPLYGWDGSFRGKQMNPAIFAYYLEIVLIDGRVLAFEGDVTLLR